MSSIAGGALLNLSARIAGSVLALCVVLLVARLGAEHQGMYALVASVEALLIAACSGFGIALARRVSHARADPGQWLSTAAGAALAGLALGVVLFAVSRRVGGAYAPLWMLACGLPLILVAHAVNGLWLGQGRMAPIAAAMLAMPVLTLLGAAAAAAALPPLTALAVIAAWVLARAVVGCASAWAAGRAARGAPDWAALRADLPFIATIGATNVISWLNYRVDLFLVEHYAGLAEAGVYSIAVMAAEALWLMSGSLSQAGYARVGTPDRAASAALVVRVLHLTLLALAACAPLLYALAAVLLPAVLGPAYAQTLPALAWLLPGVVGYGAASVLSAWFTNFAGSPRVPAAMALLSLAINVVLSVLLIPRIGLVGGALATSASYLVTIVVMLSLFRLHSGLAWPALLRPDVRQLRRDLGGLRGVFARRGAGR